MRLSITLLIGHRNYEYEYEFVHCKKFANLVGCMCLIYVLIFSLRCHCAYYINACYIIVHRKHYTAIKMRIRYYLCGLTMYLHVHWYTLLFLFCFETTAKYRYMLTSICDIRLYVHIYSKYMYNIVKYMWNIFFPLLESIENNIVSVLVFLENHEFCFWQSSSAMYKNANINITYVHNATQNYIANNKYSNMFALP